MSSMKLKLRLTGALAVLATLAFAASCRGFFVKPTVTSIALTPPTPSILTGITSNTVQMSAIANFNDGSSGSTPVSWTLDTNGAAAASITSGGLVTAMAVGSGQITATSQQNPAIAGSTTLTVSAGCITKITISPTSPSIPVTGTQTFSAQADTCNGPQDVTTVSTWVSSNTTVATMQANVATGVTAGSANITATSGGVTSAADLLTVTP